MTGVVVQCDNLRTKEGSDRTRTFVNMCLSLSNFLPIPLNESDEVVRSEQNTWQAVSYMGCGRQASHLHFLRH